MPGATYTHVIPGTATIKTGTGSAGALETLGLSEEGAAIQWNTFDKPIYGDNNGGKSGPPTDYLLHGIQAEISLTLIDYTNSVLEKVLRHRSGTYGLSETSGTLLLAGAKYFRLLIHAPNDPHNFPICMVMSGPSFPLSTNEKAVQLKFLAMFDASTTRTVSNATTN